MKNVGKEKSFQFAVRVVNTCKYLESEFKIFPLSNQLLKSGTAIGALIREAEHAQSTADFIHKLQISLKEANETLYWIELLHGTDYLSAKEFHSLYHDCEELVKILVSSIKTVKEKRNR